MVTETLCTHARPPTSTEMEKDKSEPSATKHPPAGALNRFHGNPVLTPIPEHDWESKYVLNAASVKLGRKVYMLYRSFGEDKISRIGLAVSEDGFNFTERMDKPIFAPAVKWEGHGCEDPRLTVIGERIYMTYTAFDGFTAQIAVASITIKEFLNCRWESWHRHGLFSPGLKDKDATLFPDQFGGKVAMLHRLDPDIWLTFSSDLRCPWPANCHLVLARPTKGEGWDSLKIGAGAQPIKTRYGWLLITHGVDHSKVYRLGVMLLDLDNPAKLIYRSPNFILEPMTRYEMGGDDSSWVPNVVFTCGAVPMENDKNLLDSEDELVVYYGGADSVMNVATATVGDLIPEEVRYSELDKSRSVSV